MTQQLHWGDLLVAGTDRRRALRADHRNGVDTVEVAERGRRLVVTFLERVPRGLQRANVRVDGPASSRAVTVRALINPPGTDAEREDRLIVELDRPGSPGIYTLSLVERHHDGLPGSHPFRGVDPRFAGVEFSFDVDDPNPIPTTPPPASPPALLEDISYLGRDYRGLRQLILDRMAVTIPAWTERHIPDIGITLVELFAYVGDDLSYYQDAVATEAYMQTARRRISVRRHARLVDYRMHDGCNARAWVCLEVTGPLDLELDKVGFAASPGGPITGGPVIDPDKLAPAQWAALTHYTPLAPRPGGPAGPAGAAGRVALLPSRNAIVLWSWGERNSALAAGATSAVLVDGPQSEQAARTLSLREGDVLVLEETTDPRAPGRGPADPSHRQAVRLVSVRELVDELYEQPLLDVAWAPEDALAFQLPVTSGGIACSCARGNTLLLGHGLRVSETVDLGQPQLGQPQLGQAGLTFSTPFPDPTLVARHQARSLRTLYATFRARLETARRAARGGRPLSAAGLRDLRIQFGPRLLQELDLDTPGSDSTRAALQASGLAELLARADRLLAGRRHRLLALAGLAEATGPLDPLLLAELADDWGEEMTATLDPSGSAGFGPAAGAILQNPRRALGQLTLRDSTSSPVQEWDAAADLLDATADQLLVLPEIDEAGVANLRLSAPPQSATTLTATYHVGNGTAGNLAAEAIGAVHPTAGGAGTGSLAPIAVVRNPLPAAGGIDPEDPAAVKLAVAGGYLARQQRALTAADYARLAETLPGVRRAAAELRWTGSQPLAAIAIQPSSGEDPQAELLAEVARGLAVSRRLGHVLRVRAPRYRPVVVAVEVSLDDAIVRADAADTLAALLSSGWLPDGTPGLFNPANVGFGQPVHASGIVAAVQALDGVDDVALTGLAFTDGPRRPAADTLSPGPLEIVRLDNDPRVPGNGHAVISLVGGR